jgi:antirestriction protein ArdC
VSISYRTFSDRALHDFTETLEERDIPYSIKRFSVITNEQVDELAAEFGVSREKAKRDDKRDKQHRR